MGQSVWCAISYKKRKKEREKENVLSSTRRWFLFGNHLGSNRLTMVVDTAKKKKTSNNTSNIQHEKLEYRTNPSLYEVWIGAKGIYKTFVFDVMPYRDCTFICTLNRIFCLSIIPCFDGAIVCVCFPHSLF